MKSISGILVLLWVIAGCSTSKDVKYSNEMINSSVSPRAEKKYVHSSKGSQGFSGTNSEERFDRSIAEVRQNKETEADTLTKEFAQNGQSINTEYFACEKYSVEETESSFEASNQ